MKIFKVAVLCEIIVLQSTIETASTLNIFQGFPDITDESDDVLQNYIPTLNSNNEQCRNHSLFYNEELKKFKIWAAEMFDSSGKMPSGVFYGSSHDFGNFDECLEIKVPYQDSPFVGQYCMAQFTIEPPKNLNLIHGSNYYEKSDYTKYYNDVIWEKMAVYSQDETKGSRNEFYLAFCLPSSCSPNDLKTALENNSLKINNISDFHIKVDVSNRSCQIARDIKYTIGDFLFIIFVIISVVTVIISSIYDVLIRRDTYRHLKIKGKLHNIVICCSFPRNFSKFTSKGQNLEGLDCLSGMRVYSMILIIVLHRIMFEFGSPMVNPKYVEKLYTKFETTLLLNGPILVETFFTLSGFLATYLILGQLKGSKKGVNLLLFYVHRIIRMSPTYAVILFFYCTIFIKLGTGPFWQERVGVEQERCLSSWWANLLYINNYVNTDKICMFQSWYVACDMNFFFFTPFLVWIIWKKAKLGVTIVIAFIISSILVVFVTVYMNNLDAMFMLYIKVLKDPVSHNSFKTMYIPGHMRASSYFVGILVGYIKHYMNESNMKISDKYVKIGWILCVPIMIASLYTGFVFYLLKVPPLFTALYASLYHFAWSICIAWMVIAISSGYGPWVDPILKWKPLVILARLTYCVYISHGIIQIYTAGTLRSPIYASVFNVGYQTAADVLLAYILAFLLTMMYESPIIALEKVLLRKESSLKKEADPKIEDEISTEMA
ncbi:hypothetical protein ABEB36_014925 [Hypothenemus hampei]|uniref:Nose resistant-to-fluoxetine protein N-terminal domain-containing protein n=1 Tax=Hypothenemus hampei TaxID=57062 RepID=A0ABD1E1A4_HYPHA